ncbi:hypothetical protein ACROYT_G043436 [Oculina patagonica]
MFGSFVFCILHVRVFSRLKERSKARQENTFQFSLTESIMSWRNKRVTGIVLVVVGVVFAGLAYLINNVAPGSVQGKVIEELCVSGVEHTNYEKWTNVSESTTKIYYWHIKNKEGFLYKRELPQLEERGPYVYTTMSRKIEVKFDASGKVTFKTFKQQKFNEEMTSKLCPECQEDDKLNIISLAHLGLMNRVKTADAFSSVFIPVALNHLLRDMDSKLGDRNATLSQLGNVKSTVSPVNCSCNPAFGPWLKSKPQHRGILRGRRMADFTNSEMRGLYGALLNPAVLGPPQNNTIYAKCTLKPHLEDCGLFLWLANVVLSITNPNLTSPNFNQTEATGLIMHSLCPSPSACLKNLDHDQLIEALFDFVNTDLRGYVLWSTDQNYGLLPTRRQSELALGYVMNKFPYPPAYPNGLPVPGILTSHSSHQDAIERSDSTTLHSCNSSSSEEYKFSWAEYNGKTEVNQAFFPKASSSDLKVSGHQGLFFPAKNVKSCGSSSQKPAVKEYEMFIPAIKQRTKILYEKPVVVKDLALQRYKVDTKFMAVNNRTVFTPGLLDMSGVHGFPVLLGFPRFLHGERGLGQRLGLPAADPEKHGSFVDIEPFSGSALHAVIRYQVSTVVSSNLVSSPVHPKPLNVSYVEDNAPHYRNVIPVFWTETTQEISEQQAKQLDENVFATLRKSCILTVVLSIVAGFCLFFGVVFIALSVRAGNTVSVEISESS